MLSIALLPESATYTVSDASTATANGLLKPPPIVVTQALRTQPRGNLRTVLSEIATYALPDASIAMPYGVVTPK
jgi:hypothetical protein